MFRKLFLIFLIIFLIIFSQNQKNLKSDVIVVRVIDGDTIELSDGKEIRLLGIDAPEKNEFYYEESKNFLKNLVLGKKVILEKDFTDRDKYGRYLRYVFVDKVFVNYELVRKGYAKAITRIPDVKYNDILIEAENEARKNKIGIWSNDSFK